MGLRIDSLSRFTNTESIIKDTINTFGLWQRPFFLDECNLNEDDITTISIDQNFAGRPDRIADEYYQTPLLDWIVVMFNRPLNTIGWPQAGTVIKIPAAIVVLRNF